MDQPKITHQPYTAGHLLGEARTLLPHLLRDHNRVLPGFAGIHRVPATTRLAVHIRAARIMGCPVCAGLFPRIAVRLGLSDDEVAKIAAGETDNLSPEIHSAVSWASAILQDETATPSTVPEAAHLLTDEQRAHLLYMLRLERLVHAAGLMFLPHSLIERAALG